MNEDSPVDFASLYPTYPLLESWASPRVTGKLCFARATHRGVQRGEAPLRFLHPPRLGARGLKSNGVVTPGFLLPQE